MKQFNSADMPEDVKELFLDSYRVANGTKVIVYVEGERNLLKNWLISNGCELDEEVEILYNLEVSSDKFTHDEDKVIGEDDDDEDEEVESKVEKKSKRVRIVKDEFGSDEVDFDYKMLKKEKNIEIPSEIIIDSDEEI